MLPRPADPKHSEAVRSRVAGAFPLALAAEVAAVLSVIPAAKQEPAAENIGLIFVDGEKPKIPRRVHFFEPGLAGLDSLIELQKTILGCLYTCHHDGRVREKWLRQIIGSEVRWAAPFVLQLTGEYDAAALKFLLQNTQQLKRANYSDFLKTNPGFRLIISRRILNHWKRYFSRNQIEFSEHGAFILAREIGLWDEAVKKPKAIGARKSD
jgi:hypothetical protein